MIWCRVYRQKEVVLAMADEELMGKEFADGEKVLSVGAFYRGRLVDEKEVARLVEGATVINAVGERSIRLLGDVGVPASPARIGGVPHAQVIFFR